MKKVLFVATVTKHINAFHIPYLKMFKEQGYEVHVASNGDEKIEYCDKHFNLPFERSPLKINNMKVYKELKKIINENKYEIVHSHTPVGGVLARLAARQARKEYGTKSIYTAHGFHFYKGAPIQNWIIYYPIEKICSKWTDTLITITNEDYQLAKKKFNAKRIEYVYGIGLNTERLQYQLSTEEKLKKRRELNIGKNDIVFSYIAELNENKNQKMLIEVVQRLKEDKKNIKLLLIGEGPLCDLYRNIVKEKNLEENVRILGKRADINEILSITNIYLASSLREGLPVNIMEAMYKGIPIIAMDNRGHRELIKNGSSGLLINSTDDMINQINGIICDKEKQENLVKRCSENVEKYSINNVSAQMRVIYGLP